MNLGSAENDLTAYLPVRSLVPIIEAVRAETASSAETYDRARLGTEIEKVLKNRPLASLQSLSLLQLK